MYTELQELYPLISFNFSPKHNAWRIDVMVPHKEDFIKSCASFSTIELEYSLGQVLVQRSIKKIAQSIRQKINASKE